MPNLQSQRLHEHRNNGMNSKYPLPSNHTSLCLFSSYFMQCSLPYFIRVYLDDLRVHFPSLVFITNNEKVLDEESRNWLAERQIRLMLVANEGYDFGMWHKAFTEIDTSEISELLLVNDSCIRFAPLAPLIAWCRQSGCNYAGLSDSNQHQRHIQSYFLLIRNRAVSDAIKYFRRIGVVTAGFEEVIRQYEIGLSQEMLRCGHRIGAYFSVEQSSFDHNMCYLFPMPLVRAGMPMVKRKLLALTMPGVEFDYLSAQRKYFSPKKIVRVIQSLHGIDPAESRRLFSQTLNSATWNQHWRLALRRFRRGWLYPTLGIERRRIEGEALDASGRRGFRLTGPDGALIET